jgi:beta-mannosidase
VLPHLPRLDGTDAHLWFGWYGGDVDDLASLASTLPRQVRFVSAFGAQAIPEHHRGLTLTNGRPDWEALAALGIEPDVMRRVLMLDDDQSITAWVDVSNAHQGEVVRRTIETLRRLKYRPTGGFCVHRLADPSGRAGFGLLDECGRPRPAFRELVAACRPVIVVADPLPDVLEPGDKVNLAVHIVSDERDDRAGCQVTAQLRTPVGVRSWRWQGDVAADSCALVGRVRFTVPQVPGPVALDLRLVAGDTTADNRYASRVI